MFFGYQIVRDMNTKLKMGQQYFYDGDAIRGFFGPWRFLSNFHYHSVEFDGQFYPTNEHAYQAAKFNDLEYRRSI